jgi:hypothetical protein
LSGLRLAKYKMAEMRNPRSYEAYVIFNHTCHAMNGKWTTYDDYLGFVEDHEIEETMRKAKEKRQKKRIKANKKAKERKKKRRKEGG